ncbi:MAG: anti-sigma-D factor RsdA [Pseudonocardiaceae bacterium]
MAGRDGDSHEMPADLAAVQADDALLDLIGRAGYTPEDAHDELTRVLTGWRQEMDAEPFGELVDTDTALAAIRAGRRPVRRRNPVFGSIAGAAAVVVIAFSGVGLAAKSAQPGDHLWGVTQVLYGDYAHSVETAAQVRTELNEAKTALNQGDPARARASLQRVQKQLPAIGDTEGRTDLTARSHELEQQVVQSAGSPVESPPTQRPSTAQYPWPGSPATDWSKQRAAVPTRTPPTTMPGTESDGTTSDGTARDGTARDGTTSVGASKPGRPPIPRPNPGPDSRPGTVHNTGPGPSSGSGPYPGSSLNPGAHPHPGTGFGSGQPGPHVVPRPHGLPGQPGQASQPGPAGPPELPSPPGRSPGR